MALALVPRGFDVGKGFGQVWTRSAVTRAVRGFDVGKCFGHGLDNLDNYGHSLAKE